MSLPRAMAAVGIALGLASCASMSTLEPGGRGTTFTVTGKPFAKIWEAAVRVVDRHLPLHTDNRAAGIIRAEKKAGMFTWGEFAAVYVSPTAANAGTYTPWKWKA